MDATELLNNGIAEFNADRFKEARELFAAGAALSPDDKALSMWIRKCDAELEQQQTASKPAPSPAPAPVTASVPAPRVKHDWYQTDSAVVITVLAKNVKKEDVDVEYKEQAVSISVKLPAGTEYNMELDLAFPIDTSRCSFNVMSTKVEISLRKKDAVRWPTLERSDACMLNPPVPMASVTADPPKAASVASGGAADVAAPAPKYPTSSKKGVTNWDKIEKDVVKEEKDEKLEGDAALNKLFQQIYADADEETRRAMNKSFQESGGTVLSTNWKEVKKGVEVTPPEGMVPKKWEH
eukprot:Opistho-2@55279